MYWHPKDNHPEVKEYMGFSVGDCVQKKDSFSISLGQIVRIYQPSYDDHPYILVEWYCNGAVGVHCAEYLKKYIR